MCGLFGCWTPGHDQMQHRYWVNDLCLNAHLLPSTPLPQLPASNNEIRWVPVRQETVGPAKGFSIGTSCPLGNDKDWAERYCRRQGITIIMIKQNAQCVSSMHSVARHGMLNLCFSQVNILCEYVWFPLVEGQMIRISSFLLTYMYVNNYLIIYKLILKMDEDCGR